MARGRKPRRNKIDQRLITRQQALPDANVIDFPVDPVVRAGNDLPGMSVQDRLEIEDLITRRFSEAEEFTDIAAREIDLAERQTTGLFPDQPDDGTFEDGDNRIYLKKTLEHMQVIFAHLDGLTAMLKPLLRFVPRPSGLYPIAEESARAKVKEVLVNNTLTDIKFVKDVLPRWRWNFLKHPSAYLRVLYHADLTEPDIGIQVTDRKALYIDPHLKTGNIRDAGWVIETDRITEEAAEEMVRSGHWWTADDLQGLKRYFSPPADKMATHIFGKAVSAAQSLGPERDRLVEVWYYFQAEKNGAPHAYGVMLGGKRGMLVRWGPNPYPYKGIPYRGKAYLRDTYRPDGMSLARQYRHINEASNTFLNLRITDVLAGVKRQILVFENLFDEKSQKAHAEQQRFIPLNSEFAEQILREGRRINDFIMEIGSQESTQHLLQDMQYLGTEGNQEIHTSDVFRGQNPQPGATLGQVQEQLTRSLGVFRPVYSQEMALIEEVGEIINVYFEDEDFFGPERLASIVGPNRYKKALNFKEDALSGIAFRRVQFDEMDVDVTVDVVNQAEHLASRTMRTTSFTMFMESLRNHPKMVEKASRVINFTNILVKFLEDMGEDTEAITFTQEEQQQAAQQQQQQQEQAEQKAIQTQLAIVQATEKAKGEGKAIGEQARAQGRVAELQVKASLEQGHELETIMTRTMAEHDARMAELNQKFAHDMRLMFNEAALEARAGVESVGHGNNINQ